MDNKKKKANEINIQLDEKTAEGIYSNLVVINHSHSEFVLDFVSVLPGVSKASVKSRIILTPQHIKGFHRALSDNITKFENANGEIIEQEQTVALPLFGPHGEA